MLLRLQIDNLALIERAELEFASGLNVLTGETGAGKTMLAQAIGLIAGGAAAAEMIGPHGQDAYVEAEFVVASDLLADPELAAVADLRPDGEETLIVARRLSRNGRSRALVWGRSCARADLEALAERLIEISSQHQARRLARPSVQLALLDGFAGLEEQLAAMWRAWAELRQARDALEAERTGVLEAERRRDELEDLVARVEQADAGPDEAASLTAERDRLRHIDQLTEAVAAAAALLNPDDGEGALALGSQAAELLGRVERFEPHLGEVTCELRDATVRIQEAAIALRSYLDRLELEPGRLEVVEGRLALFAELERRYGVPLGELAALAADARAALDSLEGGAERLALLEAAAAEAELEAGRCAGALSAARGEAAPMFAAAVEAELAELEMQDARLAVELTDGPLGARGGDRLELRLAANRGLAAAPLAQTASGGELSRIALAVRVAARGAAGAHTLLLDEVDAGVGGRTARSVAEKLGCLAKGAQLICITHLPQIASLADRHLRVEKAPGDPTVATVVPLAGDQIVDELARMLGGEEGDEAVRRHALALMR